MSVLASILIMIALIVDLLAFKEVESIRRRVLNLPNDYQSAYFDAYELTGTYGMLKRDKEEIVNMILEIFEHSCLEGRDVEEVIGKDITSFVEGFVSEIGKRHSLLGIFSYSTSLFIGYLLLIKAYEVMRTGTLSLESLQSETFDLGILITYFIISYVCTPWLIISIQRSIIYHWRGLKRIQILIPVILSMGLFAGLIIMNELGFGMYINRPINLFSNVWSITIGVLLLIGSFVIARVQKSLK
ncbi:MAG: DUF1048 domain-containing protein [Clostridia bacterium]|nr:DUF1048 domain-containing protein [Clostridia bacterium]